MMKKVVWYLFVLCFLFVMSAGALAAGPHKKKSELGANGIKGLNREQLIKLALLAAPWSIAKDAAVMIPGDDGKLTEVKTGTNGFTCIPDIDGMPKADPFCGDAASMQWANDLMSGAPKPTNTVPGVAYMARGGWHFEKDGKILLKKEEGAKAVHEPPHWMIFWPFDSTASGLPSMPVPFGAYVMFDGTPYAHLMIYQNPMKIK
jgi:hypothetical protein